MHAPLALQRLALLSAFAGLGVSPLPAASWPKLNPAELAETQPVVEPESGVEILASETEVDDSGPQGTVTDVYCRLKVFTREGVDKVAKIQIRYDRRTTLVRRIEARTIRPDGSILELKSQDIFEREIVKAGNQRTQAKSFAPPGLEPGVILEYRYQITNDQRTGFFPFLFEGDKPARSVVFRLRPFGNSPGLNIRAIYMNYPPQELKPDRDGFYRFALKNVRSRNEEPLAPPALHVWASVLLYYTYESAKTPDAYWAGLSRDLHKLTEDDTKPTREIAAQAQQLVAATDAPEEKLRKLHDFCRERIINRNRDGAGLTREQRRKLKSNDNAAETLRSGQGNANEINSLFVALARASGFDARLARANDRSQFMFQESLPVPFMFTRLVAAVKNGDRWMFSDPGAAYLPVGVIDWRNSDTAVLIADPKQKLIQPAPGAPADRSVRRQGATLALTEDGTLEGDVVWEYAGHFEAAAKNALDAATPDETEKYIRTELEPHLKGLELSEIKTQNANHPLEPLKVMFHLRVPEFAERTGSRLFVQPGIFRRGGRALFEADKRQEPVLFPHRYREIDEVTITLPEGFALEAGSAPAGFDLGSTGKYQAELSWAPKRRTLHYRRDYVFAGTGFNPDKYPALKRLFEVIHERDNHTLTFRQAEETGAKP